MYEVPAEAMRRSFPTNWHFSMEINFIKKAPDQHPVIYTLGLGDRFSMCAFKGKMSFD